MITVNNDYTDYIQNVVLTAEVPHKEAYAKGIEALGEDAQRKTLGVLYSMVVNNQEDMNAVKIFGKLTQEEAEQVAIFMIDEEENSDEMKQYGDIAVTESLNYFFFEDGKDNISGYYTLIE
ncbi:MAG: hypothetical protein GQ474_04875 [Sulfurimonas sp.]|nr:hypothetical protein [Sulfurimonas sp.]